MFWLVCGVLAVACAVLLWFLGERKRAWQGAVVTIVLEVLGGLLSAPRVIR